MTRLIACLNHETTRKKQEDEGKSKLQAPSLKHKAKAEMFTAE